MSKTAEEFDAQVSEAVATLVEALKPHFEAFSVAINSIIEELSKSDVPKHLQVAIITKAGEAIDHGIKAIEEALL